MMQTFTCQKCGKKYRSNKENSKYCSLDCMRKVPKVKKCLVCDHEYKPHRADQKYCSKKCQGIATTHLKERICPSCNRMFKPRKSTQVYCSIKCRPVNMENKIKTNCIVCGKVMHVIPSRLKDGRGKYCSKSCFASRHTDIECENCGKTVTIPLSDVKEHNFCSQECKSEWMSYTFSGENAWAWRGGCDNYRGDNWKLQRRKTLKRDNYTCTQCGAHGDDVKLMVHHKIPFRFFNDFYKANRLSNLATLCNSCHSQQESHLWHEVPKKYLHLIG